MGRASKRNRGVDDGDDDVAAEPAPPAPAVGAVYPDGTAPAPNAVAAMMPGLQGMMPLGAGQMPLGAGQMPFGPCGPVGPCGPCMPFGPCGMVANPALANPLLMALGQMPLSAGQMPLSASQMQMLRPPASIPAAQPAGGQPPILGSTLIDPDVQDLCEHFHIEERHTIRLNGLMKQREESFEGDMLKLWEKLEEARSPAGLLVVKMREMEEGTFVGKKGDKELTRICKKYGVDDEAEGKLADILGRHDEGKRKDYMVQLEKHLEVSNRPSAMAMMLLKKLGQELPLGRPGAPAPGSYVDKQNREKERKERGGERGGDRESDRRGGGGSGGGAGDRDRDRKGGDRDRSKRSRSKRSRSRRR